MSLKKVITGICFSVISSSAISSVYWTESWPNGYNAKITKLKPSGINCNLITGENSNGAIIAGGYQNRTIKYVTSQSASNWKQLSDPKIPVSHITGHNRTGPIIAHSRTVKYMNSYRSNNWKTLRSAPAYIEGLAGDNNSGPVIFNGQNVWYMNSYSSNRWHKLRRPAPFRIKGITGNNREGIIAYGYYGELAYVSSYASANWTWLSYPPQDVFTLSGSLGTGLLIVEDHSNSRKHLMRNLTHLTNKYMRWSVIADREEVNHIKAISGSSNGGAVFCTA